ncbi:MAG: 2-dehydropantoate 2-reductase [Bacteroidetes bacterium ADurb.Bin302]|nr:MAG: 2-dehydropantoate 2-reductase [Bacteroidetes bacterium ADurb.Bin302]
MKYAIVGTGAIGGFYGGELARIGKDVHFLLRSDYEFVKQNGLKVHSVNGDFCINPINAYNDAKQMPQCDIILVCMKTTQNHLLPELLYPLVKPSTCIVLVQNGLNIEKKLASSYPDIDIAAGMAFVCCNKIKIGEIMHLDYGKLTVSPYQGKCSYLKTLCNDLTEAGIDNYLWEEYVTARWRKLVWNIPYNGLTVVLNTTTELLMKNKASRQLVKELMEEVRAGGLACGADIPDNFIDEMLKSTDQMRPYDPSMRLDFLRHHQMEIEAIYSNPIAAAHNAGVEMPKIAMLEKQLKFIQAGYLQKV